MSNAALLITLFAFWVVHNVSFDPFTLTTPIVLGEINKINIAQAANEDKVSAAVDASKKWLALVDSKQYKKSWETASEYLKSVVTSKQLEQGLAGVRTPLGKVISRNLIAKQYVTELPGVPDGEYVVIQYQTSFENKRSSIETITPKLDNDGKWRVSGYIIQ